MRWRLLWVSLNWTWWFRVRLGPRRTVSGVWGVGPTFIPIAVLLVQLQQLDPIFNMKVDVMRPTYNFEPRYRVTALTREDIRPQVLGLVPVSRGMSGSQMGPRCGGDWGQGVWEACEKEAYSPPWEIHHSLSGRGVCHFGPCSWYKKSLNTRETRKYLLW
jgi:hypothetical protein